MNLSVTAERVLGVVVLLVLAGLGYVGVSGTSSLEDLNQTLSTLEAAILGAPQPSGTETPSPMETVTEEATAEVTLEVEQTPTPTPVPEDFVVLYPVEGETMVISSEHPEVRVRLIGREGTVKNVRIELLVYGKKDQDPLSPGLMNEAADEVLIPELTADQAQSVTLAFSPMDFPPSGTYEGWLVLTADNGKPMSRKVKFAISRPSVSIQHRLSGEDDKTISLGGVRWWPLRITIPWIRKLWPDFINNPYWEEYELRLWEENLQTVSYDLLPSELVEDSTGRAGHLVVTPLSKRVTGVEPSQEKLSVEGVQHPGTYKGVLTIHSTDGRVNETIKVTARLRDALIWPFLVIVGGALLIGWLLRVGARDAKNSAPFQRVLIETARDRLRRVSICVMREPHRKCEDVRRKLQQADLALALGDVDQVQVWLTEATNELEHLETASSRIDAAEAEFKARQAELDKKYSQELSEKMVEDEIKEAKRWLEAARNSRNAGNWSAMEQALEKMSAALDQAAERLKSELEKRDAEKERGALEDQIHYSITRFTGDVSTRVREGTAQIPVFYTDETITFCAVDQGGNQLQDQFRWEIEWIRPWSPDEDVRLPPSADNSKEYRHEIEAAPGEDYPRRYRVKALSGEAEVATTEFEVRHAYEISLPDEAYPGQSVPFEVLPWHPGEKLPEEGVTCCIEEKGILRPTRLYRPKSRGKYRVAAQIEYRVEGQVKKRWIAANTLKVVENPVDAAARRFRRQACIANIVWALVAGVVGLIYIENRVPTFGSPMDYLLALAWGLGVSTSVVPKEGAVDAIKKALGIKTTAMEEVPALKGKTKAEAAKLIEGKFTPKWEPKEAGDAWVVEEQSPEAGKKAEKDSQITITLKEPEAAPPAAAPTVNTIDPSEGKAAEGVLVVTITGTGFAEGAKVELRKNGQDPVEAKPVQVVDDKKIECAFNLEGKATGDWDVVVKVGEKEVPKKGGFKVE